jgi:hypothetical protein
MCAIGTLVASPQCSWHLTYRSRTSHGFRYEKRHIEEAQERYKHGLKQRRSIAKG